MTNEVMFANGSTRNAYEGIARRPMAAAHGGRMGTASPVAPRWPAGPGPVRRPLIRADRIGSECGKVTSQTDGVRLGTTMR
jgi:hypothetical protein